MLNLEKLEPSLQPLSISDDSTNTDTDTRLDFSASEEAFQALLNNGFRDSGGRVLPLLTTFEGINFDENGANNNGVLSIPPDPIAAAGPNHVVSVVNRSIEWHTKDGVQQNSQSLESFFDPLVDYGAFDPKVIYDQYADRFLVVSLDFAGRGDSDSGKDVQAFFWQSHKLVTRTTVGLLTKLMEKLRSTVSITGLTFLVLP